MFHYRRFLLLILVPNDFFNAKGLDRRGLTYLNWGQMDLESMQMVGYLTQQSNLKLAARKKMI